MRGAAGVFCPLSTNTKEAERHRRALMKSSSAGFLPPVKCLADVPAVGEY